MTTRADVEEIRLRQGTFLVVWALLTKTLRDERLCREIGPGNYEVSFQLDDAELRALHWLAGAIQRGVPEVMAADLQELVAEEKRWIISRPN